MLSALPRLSMMVAVRSGKMNWKRYIRAIVIVWATLVCLAVIRAFTVGLPGPVNIAQIPVMLVIHFFSFAALGTIFFLPQFLLLHRLNRDSRAWCIAVASSSGPLLLLGANLLAGDTHLTAQDVFTLASLAIAGAVFGFHFPTCIERSEQHARPVSSEAAPSASPDEPSA